MFNVYTWILRLPYKMPGNKKEADIYIHLSNHALGCRLSRNPMRQPDILHLYGTCSACVYQL